MVEVQPAAPTAKADAPRALGLPQATALILGSIIGVGIFNLPYSLASIGPISIVAMALTTVGALVLALMFAALSRRLPADGGPYAYARAAFGNGIGFAPDGEYWRRVVPSPAPERIVETRVVRQLLNSGAIVVCAGGGGAPVIRNEAGKLEGVEAVVDKDLATAVLAEALEA